MRKITIVKELYHYNELSEEGKKRAKEDYLNSQFRNETVNEYIKDEIDSLFSDLPDKSLDFSSSYFLQGSGLNIFGQVPLSKMIQVIYNEVESVNFPNTDFHDTCQRTCKQFQTIGKGYHSADEAIKVINEAMPDTDLVVVFPDHRDCYTYCIADKAYIADAMYPDHEMDEGDFMSCLSMIREVMTAFCNYLYDVSEDMYLNISNGEMEDYSEINELEYLSDGTLFE